MTKQLAVFDVLLAIALCVIGCSALPPDLNLKFLDYTLDWDTPVNPLLQAELERMDAELRARFGMTTEQTAVGVLDLKTLRLAMIHPDRGDVRRECAEDRHSVGLLSTAPAGGHELGRANPS